MITNNIKELRSKTNLSQEELADIVGVRRETICKIECSKYNPSLLLAGKISKALGVCIETVFSLEEIEG